MFELRSAVVVVDGAVVVLVGPQVAVVVDVGPVVGEEPPALVVAVVVVRVELAHTG